MGQEQTKAARLGWREGAKAREAGPGNTGSEQLGLARSELGWAERHGNRAGVDQAQNWCADSLAWREWGNKTAPALGASNEGPNNVRGQLGV